MKGRNSDSVLASQAEVSVEVGAIESANDATLAALSAEARAKQTSGRTADLVRRIKQFFDLE